jgi:predicted nucleotidyltransferase
VSHPGKSPGFKITHEVFFNTLQGGASSMGFEVKTQQLKQVCLTYLPYLQAIYLFGSWATEDEKASSDIDIALLLPVQKAKELDSLYATPLHHELEKLFSKNIDLINLRQVSTVLQKEVISAEKCIYCADEIATGEFEMLVISYYQRLNEERADILKSFYATERAIQI